MWEIILDLHTTVTRLGNRCAKLEADNEALTEQLRDGKQTMAKFTKGRRKTDSKSPERKPEQGHFTHRAVPVPTPDDEVRKVEAPWKLISGNGRLPLFLERSVVPPRNN